MITKLFMPVCFMAKSSKIEWHFLIYQFAAIDLTVDDQHVPLKCHFSHIINMSKSFGSFTIDCIDAFCCCLSLSHVHSRSLIYRSPKRLAVTFWRFLFFFYFCRTCFQIVELTLTNAYLRKKNSHDILD